MERKHESDNYDAMNYLIIGTLRRTRQCSFPSLV